MTVHCFASIVEQAWRTTYPKRQNLSICQTDSYSSEFLVNLWKNITSQGNIYSMSKIKRGGYIFVSWIGDHPPPHVHVYRNGRLVVKWNFENGVAMKGSPTAKILSIIDELLAEGKL